MSEVERKVVKFDPYANYSKLWLTFVDAGRSCGYQIPGVLPPTLIEMILKVLIEHDL